MKESYDKSLNVLMLALSETNGSTREKVEETQQIVRKFMQDGLPIENPSCMALVDCHRLPQRLVFQNREKVIRPIIIQLSNAMNKRYLFRKSKHLKTYISARRLPKEKNVFITEHLPKTFQKERKQLMPQFKLARRLDKKTAWRAEAGHYNLYVDNIKINLN